MRPFCLAALLLVACGDDSSIDGVDVPETYVFAGRTGTDSVAYSGQVFRQLLIDDMKLHVGSMTARIDSGWFPAPGDVRGELDFYYRYDGDTSGELSIATTTEPAALQASYGEISSKNLADKLAGNDPTGQHVDWSTGLRGWEGASTPEGLLESWFDQIDALAVARANGQVPLDPSGSPTAKVYLTDDGLDLLQLTEKFLRGAVAFSQGADDYLDDDLDGKGLLADHSTLVEGKPYTELEHQWDEGFGYFGASREYGRASVADLAASPCEDTDQDGAIDLLSEMSWGHSRNAAKRDLGADPDAPTAFAAQAWAGLAGGRALLDATDGPLTDAELDELRAFRDQGVAAWERAIAASAVHYLNEVLRDMGTIGTDEYGYADHAKHWSELKGFALSLQFNPRSSLTDADFEALHASIGDRPALGSHSGEERAAYADDLRTARTILAQAYGFDPANLGDDNGDKGW